MNEHPESPREAEDELSAADPRQRAESPSEEDLLPTTEEGEESPELHALRARAAETDQIEARLRRVEADYVNESKRLKRLADNDRKFAIEKVIVDLVPILDALHSAGTGLGDSDVETRMREGLDLIGKQLLDTLKRHGVEPIEAEGAFDPNRHEALFTVPRDDVPEQTIVEVMRPGFALHGRVVRPAEVAVSTRKGG